MTRIIAAVIAAGLIFWPARPATADPSESKERSLELYKDGAQSYKKGEYDRALKLFLRAYDEHPSPAYLYNIAQSYRELGRCRLALRYYDRFVAESDNESYRETIARRADKLRKKCDEPPPPAPEPAIDVEPDPKATPEPATVTEAPSEPAVMTGQNSGPAENPATITEPAEPTRATPPGMLTGLSLTAAAGPAFHDIGEVVVPVTASLSVGADYAFAAGPTIVSAGGAVFLAPMPYTSTGGERTALLTHVLATVGARYPLTPRIAVGLEVGAGALRWPGLASGNPFADDQAASDAALTLAGRAEARAEVALTSNLAASLAPAFVMALAPDAVAADIDRINRIEILLGLQYVL